MPPKPTILAFDTSAAHCAAVLLLRGKMQPPRVEPMLKGQAERLFPMIEHLLAENNITPADLTAIAVGTGPGNFTGVRISVSAARGLALSLAIPAIGISRLDAMAYATTGPQTALIDARQGKFYTQSFLNGAAIDEIGLVAAENVSQKAPLIDAEIPSLKAANPQHIATETLVENIAKLALSRLNTDAQKPAPIYVKAPDAALPADPPPTILP